MSSMQQNETEKPGEASEYECPICKDKEFVFSHIDEDGYDMHKPCDCRDRKAWKRRFKNSLIPEEFTTATIENFERTTEMQEAMFAMTSEYLIEALQSIGRMKNFGLIATLGEQRIRSVEKSEDRTALKTARNNFGIGKTHLQIGLSKKLIKNGFNVLVISDVVFMDEVMNAKRMNDEGTTFNALMAGVLGADFLVWDDIGKAKPTEAKEAIYYQIINERYKKQKPIIFNSNEDRGTLAERIGYAASDRLIGKCGDYLLETEGESWRLKKHE